jgi:hypothetical protein
VSEFSLFFRVRPGHENDLREAVRALQDSPDCGGSAGVIWLRAGRSPLAVR